MGIEHAVVDFMVTGEVFCDLVFTGVRIPDPGTETFADRYAFSPGGSVNRAVASARLGRHTGVLSAIGDDPLGRAVLDLMADEPNLDLTWLARRPGWQTPVSVAISGAEDRSFITYYEPTQPVGLTGMLPQVGVLDIGISGPLPDWAHALRAAGTQLYAGAGWDDTGQWRTENLDRLVDLDAFVLNSVEACSYARLDTPAEAARALGRYVPLVVITCGPDGVVAYERSTDELVHVAGVRVDAADPTGAGDTFVAGFAASYDLDWPLEDRLRLANLAAALSVRGLGGAASAPDAAQLGAYLTDHPGSLPEPDAAGWARIQDWLTPRSSVPASEDPQ
ncbi:MAG: carbohydrate kinase family protein [Actinobacteria bacterium]|nr:carbohydrate kinase family protein [Actinomycetota bacterium]MCG2801037.1 carbohydrate kinase family protein [Cellulomonas sp.]